MKQIVYLGQITQHRRLAILDRTTEAIEVLQAPTNDTQWCLFLVLCKICQGFVLEVSQKVASLTRQVRTDQQYKFKDLKFKDLEGLKDL